MTKWREDVEGWGVVDAGFEADGEGGDQEGDREGHEDEASEFPAVEGAAEPI